MTSIPQDTTNFFFEVTAPTLISRTDCIDNEMISIRLTQSGIERTSSVSSSEESLKFNSFGQITINKDQDFQLISETEKLDIRD
jgi:hypothetical protein